METQEFFKNLKMKRKEELEKELQDFGSTLERIKQYYGKFLLAKKTDEEKYESMMHDEYFSIRQFLSEKDAFELKAFIDSCKIQKLVNKLKKNSKSNLSTKNYQILSSNLGSIKQLHHTFCTTNTFESAKKCVSSMQSISSKIKKFLQENDKEELNKFISSLQSEVNEFGNEKHNRLMSLLEQTGANIGGVPAFCFSGDSDDYIDYQTNRNMAESLL